MLTVFIVGVFVSLGLCNSVYADQEISPEDKERICTNVEDKEFRRSYNAPDWPEGCDEVGEACGFNTDVCVLEEPSGSGYKCDFNPRVTLTCEGQCVFDDPTDGDDVGGLTCETGNVQTCSSGDEGNICLKNGEQGECQAEGNSVVCAVGEGEIEGYGGDDSNDGSDSNNDGSGSNNDGAGSNNDGSGIEYCSYTSFPGIGQVCNVCNLLQALRALFYIVLFIAVIGAFVYAGYLFLTSAANASAQNKAKEVMTGAVVGLALGLSSFIIIQTLNPDLLGGSCGLESTGSTNGGGSDDGGGGSPIGGEPCDEDPNSGTCHTEEDSPGQVSLVSCFHRNSGGGLTGYHGGVDYSLGGTGTPVPALEGGEVIEACQVGNCGGFGSTVTIDTNDGEYSIFNYSHLNSIEVSEGTQVEKGQIIGTEGCTGSCEGPHVDTKISNCNPFNPSCYGQYRGQPDINPGTQYDQPATAIPQSLKDIYGDDLSINCNCDCGCNGGEC